MKTPPLGIDLEAACLFHPDTRRCKPDLGLMLQVVHSFIAFMSLCKQS